MVVYRTFRRMLLISAAVAGLSIMTVRAQQAPTTGDICVSPFLDADRSGARVSNTPDLANINVELTVNSTLVIANYVTNGTLPFCFRALPPGDYTVRLSSPDFEPSSSDAIQLQLTAGGQIKRDVGMAPKAKATAAPDTLLYVPLTMRNRILLSVGGAAITMALSAALGLVIYGFFLHRRKPKSPYGKLSGRTARPRSSWEADTFEPSAPQPLSRGKQPIELDDEAESGFDSIEWKKPDA